MIDPVLDQERTHLDRSRAYLAWMRDRAAEIADVGADELTSYALGAVRATRLKRLADDGTVPPFFGRTDRKGEVFHIGRWHIRDEAGTPLVIDWRAGMAMPFYRATVSDPQGVSLRRRFGFADGELTSYEDERLDLPAAEHGQSRILLEEIERPRVGPMRDIVATIQPDQDEIVRAPLEHDLCVQGAPGTGKTAVGLHRAAFLLYTYPERLRQAKVLIVGPNRAFLAYISQVLPALGEYDVDQCSVTELTAVVPVRAEEAPDVATLKGDARMAEVIRRAIYHRIAKPTDSVLVPLAGRGYRVPEQRLRRHVDDLRRSDVSYAAARERLALAVAEDARRQKEAAGGSPTDAEVRRAARSAEVKAFCDEVWPALNGPGLVADLLSDPELMSRAARGILDEAEQSALLWARRPRSVGAARWTAADTVLVDEAAGITERVRSYGHVILDEAQDLSPMQCRAVARRCTTGSVTVLGDIAQGTSPWAIADWRDTLDHLGKPAAAVEPLTLGYRVPAEIIEYANRLLPHIAPELAPATSARGGGGDGLRVRSAPGGGAGVPAGASDELPAQLLTDEVRRLLDEPGSVGVICADAWVPAVLEHLSAAGMQPSVLTDAAAGPRLSVVPASLVKGLEFDHVLVLEPAEIVAAEPRGLRRLYVCLTRAVTSLVVLHTRPLPHSLTAPG